MGNGGADSSDLAVREPDVPKLSARLEQALVEGDLKGLSTAERVEFYNATCRSLGLNPLTKPFGYIVLNGKLTLYAQKACTDDLRKIHGVSIVELREERDGDVYKVWATAKDRTGRTDCDLGSVPLGKLTGDSLSNAQMKCITKAKRRVTLSICGLGWLDETEVTTIPGARPVEENAEVQPVLVRPRRTDQKGATDGVEQPSSRSGASAARPADGGGARLDGDRQVHPPAPGDQRLARREAEEPASPVTLTPEENARLDRELAAEEQAGLFTGDPARELTEAGERSPGAFITDAQVGHLISVCRKNAITDEALKVHLLNQYAIGSKKRIPRVLFEAICQWVERQDSQRKTHARLSSRRSGRR